MVSFIRICVIMILCLIYFLRLFRYEYVIFRSLVSKKNSIDFSFALYAFSFWSDPIIQSMNLFYFWLELLHFVCIPLIWPFINKQDWRWENDSVFSFLTFFLFSQVCHTCLLFKNFLRVETFVSNKLILT